MTMKTDFHPPLTERDAMQLARDTFGIPPVCAVKMTFTHSGNSIFSVQIPDRDRDRQVIVRMRQGRAFQDTAANLAILRELGLPVPRVIIADTTAARYSFSYVILEMLPGRDLYFE